MWFGGKWKTILPFLLVWKLQGFEKLSCKYEKIKFSLEGLINKLANSWIVFQWFSVSLYTFMMAPRGLSLLIVDQGLCSEVFSVPCWSHMYVFHVLFSSVMPGVLLLSAAVESLLTRSPRPHLRSFSVTSTWLLKCAFVSSHGMRLLQQ